MFALLILLSQKQDPSRNESYTLIKMCKCVGFFFEGGWTPLHDPSLFFNFHGCGLSFSFFSFWHALWACGVPSLGMHLSFLFFFIFFLTCLLSMWHTFFGYASFYFFCMAHILDGHFRENHGGCFCIVRRWMWRGPHKFEALRCLGGSRFDFA